ncbi:MAG: hypothetical protein OEZ43_02630 [Gammaproteobacteria bacterium]|nr:hypothetical protein [Gammaproteobacteria bacterium]
MNMKLIVGTIALTTLVGCAAPAKVSQMTLKDSDTSTYIKTTPLSHRIVVDSVEGGENGVRNLRLAEVGDAEFRLALEESLEKVDLLAEDSSAPYALSIKILNFKRPNFGLTTKVSTTIQYSLTRKADKHNLFERIISSEHTATLGDSILGFQRVRIATAGAVRNNIEFLLQQLKELKVEHMEVALR